MPLTPRKRFSTIIGAALLVAANANAAERARGYLGQPVEPPERSFELSAGLGYTQGFGNVAPSQSIRSVGGAGVGAALELGYRADANTSFGVEAQYQELMLRDNTGARGFAANIGATYHFMPRRRGDVWVRFGTGYRMFWDVHPDGNRNVNDMYHGFDLVSLKVGYDIQASTIAVSPVVGADMQTFIWRDATSLASTQLGTFLFAGIQGRFDTRAPAHR